ncbi:chorismate-binding protein [Lentzea chajnantorensis]
MSTHERSVPFAGDALEAAAALARTAAEPHVVHENGATVHFAEGEAETVTGGLADVARLAGRTAYGWVSFERTGHLAVPRAEVRFADGTAVLRADDEAALDVLEKRLADVSTVDVVEAGVRAPVETHGAEEYRSAVGAAVADIRAGLLDRVVLSRIVPVPGEVDFAATYLAGRRGGDPARSALLRLGGWEVLGFDPEVVTRVDTARGLVTQALAPSSGDPVFDVAWREEPSRAAGAVFERAVAVRLAAAELAGVCEPGSVRVAQFPAAEVTGALSAGRTSWDALAALLPAVTASGVPKTRACALIDRVEPERGLYGGAVVLVEPDGSLDAVLVLRGLFRHGGRTWLRAGADVAAKPGCALEETTEKLRSVSRFLVPLCA